MVYTLSASPVRLHSFDTAPNPRGTFALSLDPHPAVLAFPARVKGQVAIVDLSRSLAEAANGTRGQTPAATLIAAHTSRITCLALSPDGSRLASASEKGTLIRVFDTRAGRLVAELRRGVDRVELYTVAFNPAGTRLCVTSDKGTVHVFNLISTDGSNPVQSSVAPDDDEFDPADPEAQWPTASAPNGPLQTGNRQSHLSFLPLRYFSSSWSFARFSVPGELRCIAGFIPSAPTEESLESLLIVCMDGGVYKVAIDPEKGGDCAVQWFSRCWRPTSGGKWTGVDEHEFFQGMAVLNPSEKPQNEKEWVPDRRKPSSEKGDRGVEKIYPKVEELPAVDSNGSPYATEAMRNALEETMSTPTLRQGGPPQGQDGKARKNPPASANPKSLSASVPAPIPKRTKPESNKRPSMGKLMLVERVDDWETDF